MIVFRCDSSFEIGTGHVTRCLVLANQLKELNCSVHFVCQDLNGNIHQRIKDLGFAVTLIPADTSGLAEITALKPSWLVVDHYQIDEHWERQFQGSCSIFVIDDLKNRRHFCQVLLDQNLHENAHESYLKLVPLGTRLLLGPQFALIKHQFAKKKDFTQTRKQILIFFGGADVSGETLKFVEELETFSTSHHFRIVVTQAHKMIDSIKNLKTKAHYEILISPPNWSDLLAESDFYIGSGGTVTWERMQVGLPGAVVAVADNQFEIAQTLSQNGYQFFFGLSQDVNYSHLLSEVEKILSNDAELFDMSSKSASLVRSFPKLLAQEILEPIARVPFQMKTAQMKDAQFLFDLRNDPITRAMSISQEPLQWDSHCEWLVRKLGQDRARLYISYVYAEPAGQLRIDPNGEVSIAIASKFRGQGLAPKMIETGIQLYCAEFAVTQPFLAQVKSDNPASLKSFQKAGFEIFNNNQSSSPDSLFLRYQNADNN